MAHNQIKTYTFAESGSENPMFILKRMEDIYFNGDGESDSPHRHDYYAIILVEKGKGHCRTKVFIKDYLGNTTVCILMSYENNSA